jgi:predicted amidophosphoribosyltransferase
LDELDLSINPISWSDGILVALKPLQLVSPGRICSNCGEEVSPPCITTCPNCGKPFLPRMIFVRKKEEVEGVEQDDDL